jgi:hypothetical protein
MFDRITLGTPDVHVYSTVTEKRAPTDESVRLLREMEAKSREQVQQSIRLDNTAIDGVLQYHKDIFNDQQVLGCVFSVKGKRMEAKYVGSAEATREDLVIGIRDAIAREIANHLTATVAKACVDLKWVKP